MIAGLRVYNDNGVVQVDDYKRNFVLFAKGVGVSDQNSRGTTISVPSSKPLIACVYSPSGAILSGGTYEGGAYKFSVATYIAGEQFEWYTFSDEYIEPSNTFGLKVFNENGQLMFNSNLKPMSIVKQIRHRVENPSVIKYTGNKDDLPSEPNWSPPQINFGLKANRKYAATTFSAPTMGARYAKSISGGKLLLCAQYYYVVKNYSWGIALEGALWYPEAALNPISNGSTYSPSIQEEWYTLRYWIIDVTGL